MTQNTYAVDESNELLFIINDVFLQKKVVTIFKEFPNNHSSTRHVQHYSFFNIPETSRIIYVRGKTQVQAQ